MNHLITCCGCVCRNNCQMALFFCSIQIKKCNAMQKQQIKLIFNLVVNYQILGLIIMIK